MLKNIEECTAGSRFVLVVDSNDRNRQFLTTLLTQFKYRTYPVTTVQEALETVAVINPVFIVAARQLDGEHDAVGLITSIRSASPENAAPILVLSSGSDPAFERACLNAGALTCLRAPVSFENFYRVIQVAVEPIPRMTIRISTDLPAAINGARTDERVHDLSEGGVYVQTSTLHPRNTKLQVQIKLPDCVVSADAAVIYAKKAEGKSGSGLGLLFEHISPEDQQRIRLFIRREMTKAISPILPAK